MSIEPVDALEQGRAHVDLSAWWKIRVEGTDASGWLNDLLTAELDGIREGEMRRSMLLSPTGKIRAAVGVTVFEDGYLLIQDPVQPSRIDVMLDPYVLSSDVRVSDRSSDLGLIAFPNGDPPSGDGFRYSPSVLGPGTDVIAPRGSAPMPGLGVEAGPDDVEAWRVRRGVARLGVDLSTDSLPHEVELGEVIAHGKGCFLGQESVAKVRNLGHPPFVLLAADAAGHVDPGDLLLAEDREAGIVTSAAAGSSGGTALIARVRWGLKDSPLRTAFGVEVQQHGPASAA